MWLAVDAAGPGVRAWPVGPDGVAGDPIAADRLETLRQSAGRLVVDGARQAPVLACPIAVDGLAAASTAEPIVLPRLRNEESQGAVAVARLVGALELTRWRDAPGRGRLVGCCDAEGSLAWVFAKDGRIERLLATPTGANLSDLLQRTEAASADDEDDDVAFERGLSIAEDAQDLAGDLDRVVGEVGVGRLRGGAAGAAFAGVLIAHDTARSLKLGRLGAPAALVGAGLLADRYAIALGRFGVAVRRIDSVRALVAGCRVLGRMSDSDCEGKPSH